MRRIIILETEPQPDGFLGVRFALWANVPTARQTWWQQRQGSTFTSAVLDGSVTPTELTALQTGAVVESVRTSKWPTGTTFASAQSLLQQEAQSWQSFVNGYDPWAHYGTFFDDSTGTWTQKAVA